MSKSPNPDVIRGALAKLDPEDDDHWTTQGLPTIRAVMDAIGPAFDRPTREGITDADPEFTRDIARQRATDELESLLGASGEEPHTEGPTEPVEKTYERVIDRPIKEIVESEDLVVKALGEVEAELHEARTEIKRIEAFIAQRSQVAAHLDRVREAYQKRREVNGGQAVEYKRIVGASRERKMRRRQQVGKALAGLDLSEIADDLDPRARIDKVLQNRPDPKFQRKPVPLQET